LIARVAIILAFAGAAGGIVFPKACDYLHVAPFRFLHMSLAIPAVVLGTRSWLTQVSAARTWPVLACVAVSWLGLLYASGTESLRGLWIAAGLTIPLPVAALIVEQRAWWLAARTFVFCSAAMLAAALWFEFRIYGPALGSLSRFGYLISEDRTTDFANPNRMGGQLTVAAVLGLILYLRGLRAAQRPSPTGFNPGIGLGWSMFLVFGFILTASRTALLAWTLAGGLLLLGGTQGLSIARLRNLAGTLAVLLALALGAVTATGVVPWERLKDRVVGESSRGMSTLGSRMPIWSNAFRAWTSSPSCLLMGTGTGVAEYMLAEYDEHKELDDYGRTIRSTHSIFIEWILSFGLIGAVPGLCLLAGMAVKARQFDLRDGVVDRQALLLTVIIYAASAVLYRQTYWLAPASLVLAMLSEPVGRVANPATAALGLATPVTGSVAARLRVVRGEGGAAPARGRQPRRHGTAAAESLGAIP
jgi:hypothetical protein